MTTPKIFYFFGVVNCLVVLLIALHLTSHYILSNKQPILYKFFQVGFPSLKHENQTDTPLRRYRDYRPRLVFDSPAKFPYFPSNSYTETKHQNKSKLIDKTEKRDKLILIYKRPSWLQMLRCSGGMPVCPVSCTCSDSHDDVTRADGVVFFAVNLPKEVPTKRSSQMWIFFGTEPPPKYYSNYKLPEWRGVFNWKMTYRLDSDIVVPISILTRRWETRKNYTKIALSKTKSAAWIVSHCNTQSKREKYVKTLQKYYPVDIFGKCGPKGRVSGSKVDLLQDYRFYFSFENSICVDYITEKFFQIFDERLDVIPVVRGGANYSELVPASTYINAADYPSPKALAAYLNYLERNVTAYASILREKDKYVAEGTIKSYQSAFCDLCVHLHGNEYSPPSDAATWLVQGACRKPNDY